MNIIFLGSAGIGKGTYARFISQHFKIPTISAGVLLREQVEAGTKLGKEAEKHMKKGNLVPSELVDKLIQKRIAKPDCRKGFIFDGYPRTVEQAKFSDKKIKIDAVINFKAPLKVILDRLGGRIQCSECGFIYHVRNIIPKREGICDRCGAKLIVREDDKPAAIKKRLEIYRKEVKPVIAYYRKKGVLHEVDASANISTPAGKQIVANTIKIISALK